MNTYKALYALLATGAFIVSFTTTSLLFKVVIDNSKGIIPVGENGVLICDDTIVMNNTNNGFRHPLQIDAESERTDEDLMSEFIYKLHHRVQEKDMISDDDMRSMFVEALHQRNITCANLNK